MSLIEKRRFDFIPKEVYDDLDKDVLSKLKGYREQYRLCILKEKKINSLKKQISDQREMLSDLRETLIEKYQIIEYLKDDFQFFGSVVSYKKGNHRYWNLCLSRVKSGQSKSISLGREEKIKEHLLKHYKGNRKRVSEIKKNWKQFLKDESNYGGETYIKIFKMICKNPLGFKDVSISKNDLFPL